MPPQEHYACLSSPAGPYPKALMPKLFAKLNSPTDTSVVRRSQGERKN
jgi:hypothetical protein